AALKAIALTVRRGDTGLQQGWRGGWPGRGRGRHSCPRRDGRNRGRRRLHQFFELAGRDGGVHLAHLTSRRYWWRKRLERARLRRADGRTAGQKTDDNLDADERQGGAHD